VRLRFSGAFTLGLLAVMLPSLASAQWVTARTDTLAGTVASERSTRFSVAVDAMSRPHAIWSTGSSLVYARMDAGSWITPIVLSQGDATYAGLAVVVVPGTTRPCVLYSRTPFGAQAGELLLAEWNGSSFDVRTLTADGVAKYGPAIAMDASGAYHVVFVVQASGEWRLRYLTNTAGPATDTLLTVGPLGAFGSGTSPAIAVEPGGIAHVAYRGVSPVYRIHHAQNAAPGGVDWSWEALISPNFEDTSADIELDALGNVYVAASGADCDVCTRRTHIFQRPPGSVWNAPTPIVHANGLTAAVLAVGTVGGAQVAMSEISGSLLTGRVFHAGSLTDWAPSLVVGNDHGTPSLALDGFGVGHLVCTTGANTGARNVLYLRSAGAVAGVDDVTPAVLTGWRASPNPFWEQTVIRLPDGVGTKAAPGPGAALIVVDLAGRIVRHLESTAANGGGVEYVWDGLGDNGREAPAGVYRIAAIGGGTGSPAGATKVLKLR
jgi:hypothetical protein